MPMTEDDYRHAPAKDHGSGEGGRRPTTLGRIQLKQVRLTRSPARPGEESIDPTAGGAMGAEESSPGLDPGAMERLVGYLDLFDRLSDGELACLSNVDPGLVQRVRLQIEDVRDQLGVYADLLPRLSNEELARLTQTELAVVRFWRLSQPWGSVAWQTTEGSDLRQVPDANELEPSMHETGPNVHDDTTDIAMAALDERDFAEHVVAPELRAVEGPPPRGRAYAVGRDEDRLVPVELEDDGYEFMHDD